ncbi:MAG: hypothetical protein IJK84_10490 [Bacteroidales bacterium]|nr:hypothetical protein [Bacteroidales bacterium]
MRHIKLLLLSALLLNALGCSKKDMEGTGADTHLDNITTSGCLMKTDALAAKDMNTDSINVTIAGGTLSVTHYNMMLDCGSGENIVTTMEIVGDTIMVTEDVGVQGQVDCLCLYNNSFQIVDLPTGGFTLVIKDVASYCGQPQQRIVYQHHFNN